MPTYLSPPFHPGKSCKSNGNLIICKWISRSQVREATERQSSCLFPLDINSIQHGWCGASSIVKEEGNICTVNCDPLVNIIGFLVSFVILPLLERSDYMRKLHILVFSIYMASTLEETISFNKFLMRQVTIQWFIWVFDAIMMRVRIRYFGGNFGSNVWIIDYRFSREFLYVVVLL